MSSGYPINSDELSKPAAILAEKIEAAFSFFKSSQSSLSCNVVTVHISCSNVAVMSAFCFGRSRCIW